MVLLGLLMGRHGGGRDEVGVLWLVGRGRGGVGCQEQHKRRLVPVSVVFVGIGHRLVFPIARCLAGRYGGPETVDPLELERAEGVLGVGKGGLVGLLKLGGTLTVTRVEEEREEGVDVGGRGLRRDQERGRVWVGGRW